MIGEIVERIAQSRDVIRVTVSDREGLLIAAFRGGSDTTNEADEAIGDDLWNAYMAQFASNLKTQLRNLTLARPLELVIHSEDDAIVVSWLNVGWLFVRVRDDADWPRLWNVIRGARDEFDALTGEPVSA